MDLETLLQIAFRRKGLVLGVAVITALLVFMLGRLLLSYEVRGSVLIKPLGFQRPLAGASRQALAAEVIQPEIGFVHAPQMSLLAAYGDNFIDILTSRSLIGRVVTQLELDREYSQNGLPDWLETLKQPVQFLLHGKLPTRERNPFEQAIESIEREISAEFIYQTSIIQLFVKDEAASQAVRIANTLMDEFVAYSKELNSKQARTTAKFIKERLTSTYTELKRQRQLLATVKETYGVPIFAKFAEELARLTKNLDTLEIEYEKNSDKKKVLEDKVAWIEKELHQYPEYKVSSSTTTLNSTLIDLKKKLFDLRVNLQTVLFDYAPTSPQVTSLKAQIGLLEEAIAAEVERLLTSEISQANPIHQKLMIDKVTAEPELAASAILDEQLFEQIQDHRERLTRLTEGSVQAVPVESTISALETQGVEFQNYLDMIELIEVKGLSEVQILDRPITPRYPVIRGAPLAIYVFTGFCTGLIVAVVGVVWQEQRYATSTRNAEENIQPISS